MPYKLNLYQEENLEEFNLRNFVKENYTPEEIFADEKISIFLENEFAERYKSRLGPHIECVLKSTLDNLDTERSSILGYNDIGKTLDDIENIIIAYLVRDKSLDAVLENTKLLENLVEADCKQNDRVVSVSLTPMIKSKKLFDWGTKTYKNND